MCLAFCRAAVLGQVADVVPPVTAVCFTTVQQVASLLTPKRYCQGKTGSSWLESRVLSETEEPCTETRYNQA